MAKLVYGLLMAEVVIGSAPDGAVASGGGAGAAGGTGRIGSYGGNGAAGLFGGGAGGLGGFGSPQPDNLGQPLSGVQVTTGATGAAGANGT